MRRLLNRNGVSVVRVREVATYGEVGLTLREFGLPAVVKPVNSPDGRGAALVRTDADLARWAEPDGCAGSDGSAALEGPFTVEDFLEGPEFSVETLTVDGMHLVAGITATAEPVGPAPLGELEAGAIRATVAALLDLAGHESGPAHTEVVLTRTGPRIRECRACSGADRDPPRAGVAAAGRIPAAHPAPRSTKSTPAPKEALR
ncbi:ATP-grasp domain-containing protein [Streptomyces avidinii]